MLSATVLTACSDDKFDGDAPKDWAGTTYLFTPTDEAGFRTYYTPTLGRCGDPMPFYDKKAGDFKVLYLQEYEKNAVYRFHPIWAVSTTDGCNYASLGEVLPTANNDYAQDAALGTGCAYYSDKDGLYYIYYTGHNGNCQNREVVLRATSTDFKTWTKDIAWSMKGTDYGYSANDFRDPQIFEADGTYHMVIATYPAWGGDPVFAEFKSGDLRNWEHVGSFKMIWDRMLECPDVFKMGNYWYLVYSESFKRSWSRKVKYMMADSWENLKKCFDDPGANWPKDGKEGVLDSRAFYAGKTASDGNDRYIWGWCPFRSGADIHEKNISVGAGDGNEPNWSGALVCHKIIQHTDGTLTLGAVPAMAAKYNQPLETKVMQSNGYTDGTLKGDGAYVLYSRLGNCNHISFTVKTSNNWDKFGISVVRATDSKKYYTMVVNPEDENHRKVNFEQEGEDGKGFIEAIDGYWFERPQDNVYHVDIYTDNSVLVMYINDVCAYTQRIYGIQKNCWSINNYGGSVTISDVKVTQY